MNGRGIKWQYVGIMIGGKLIDGVRLLTVYIDHVMGKWVQDIYIEYKEDRVE